MKKVNYCILLITLLASCQNNNPPQEEKTEPTSEAQAPNTLSKAEKDAGWELLFDGKTTEKWRGYNRSEFPTLGWKVLDGTITVEQSGTEEEGFGGDIITQDSFENFELTLEFMLTDTANSGIFYRVKEVPNTPIWHNAPEYQLLDNATYATMGITSEHFTAANYDLNPAETDYTKPIGEWNLARILVKGNHVEHWLNGNQVVTYELESPEWEALVAKSKFADYPDFGRTHNAPIGLQDHGHRVQFRNIKIRRL